MNVYDNLPKDAQEELIEMVKETLESYDGYACDLHNEVFNTNYYIVGTYKAKKWLEKNYGVFEAINAIKEYEQDNFGEVNTDLSGPERVCNMLVYIAGEELLSEIEALNDCWNSYIDDDSRAAILEEMS